MDVDQVALWKRQAQEARLRGATSSSEEVRRVMFAIADDYEALARRALSTPQATQETLVRPTH